MSSKVGSIDVEGSEVVVRLNDTELVSARKYRFDMEDGGRGGKVSIGDCGAVVAILAEAVALLSERVEHQGLVIEALKNQARRKNDASV